MGELAKRELEILRLIADGLPNKEIAHEFLTSENTVKTQVSKILFKLSARNKAHAVAIGKDMMLI